MSSFEKIVEHRLESASRALDALKPHAPVITAIAEAIEHATTRGGTILTCGNGGSAAEALHLAEELVGRYEADRPPLRAICLNADSTALTCIGNDYGFDRIFARQCEAFAGPDDALVVFSTSGRSPNVVEALRTARDRGARTIGLLGGDGSDAAPLCEIALIAPGEDSAAIQECHQVALHAICNCLEPRQ